MPPCLWIWRLSASSRLITGGGDAGMFAGRSFVGPVIAGMKTICRCGGITCNANTADSRDPTSNIFSCIFRLPHHVAVISPPYSDHILGMIAWPEYGITRERGGRLSCQAPPRADIPDLMLSRAFHNIPQYSGSPKYVVYDMTNDTDSPEATKGPSKAAYIGAFLLASFSSNILMTLLDLVIAEMTIASHQDLNTYFLVGSLVSIAVVSGSFILVYSMFGSLNVRKVMPYIYAFGALGTLASMGRAMGDLRELGVDPSLFFILAPVAFIASVLIIRRYFRAKPDRWR